LPVQDSLPRNAALVIGLTVSALGALVLAGWVLDIASLRHALPFSVPMRANAALGFVLCGAALATLSLPAPGFAARAFAAGAGGLAALIGALTLSQEIGGWDLGIDHLVARDLTRITPFSIAGRMSPPTSFCFLLAGASLLASACGLRFRVRIPLLLATGTTVMLIGGIALLGHATQQLLEVRFLSYARIAVYSAFAFALLGAGVFILGRRQARGDWALNFATTGGFALGLFAMVTTAGVSYQFTSQMRDDATRVKHTLEVLRELRELGSQLGEFTISAGRYIITRDESTLANRENIKSSIASSVDRLRNVVKGSGVRERIDLVDKLHARRVTMSEQIIADFRRRIVAGDLPRPGDPSPLGEEYPALGREIERLVDAMEREEQTQLALLQARADATAARTFLLLPLGVFVSMLLLMLGLFFLNAAAAVARRADTRYRTIFDSVPVGITMTEAADGRLLSANSALLRMLGFSSLEEMVAARGATTREAYPDPGARDAYRSKVLEDGAASGFETTLWRKDGSQALVLMNGRAVQGPEGEPLLVTMVEEITLRREQEQRIARLSRVKEMQSSINAAVARLRERQALLDEICRVAVEKGGFRAAWVAWHDQSKRRFRPVASAGHFEGYLDLVDFSTEPGDGAKPGITLGVLRSGLPTITNDLRAAAAMLLRDEALKRGYRSSVHLPLKVDGETVAVLALYAEEIGFFDEEERPLLEGLAADVSHALSALEKSRQLDYLSYYDPLTGLPNRSLFQDRLSHSLRSRDGDSRLIAVVLLDLERFRRVNESHGRSAGDELLREAGTRLQKANDTAARLGVDMFALVLRGARTVAEVSRALESILAAVFTPPFLVGREELRVACRVGVSVHPSDGGDADTLLRNAEAALRRSKGESERVTFYAPEMNARVAESLAIENKLRRAIERREFVLHYQPKVDLASERITGLEALIRWQEPAGALVPPGKFIPVLEETGMIVEVGRWAVEQAFADLNAWASRGLPVPRVAVNVSAVQLQRKEFVDTIIEEIERGGEHPERLELEITESLVMRNVEESTRKLSILRGMGVCVAIDDFGTGYSSLSYLGRLPVDLLKIDRSFIHGVADQSGSVSIVTTIISLAHGLKLEVVAEGVETREQANILRLLRCDQAQGYLFSRPLPAADIERLLAAKAG
jgi:diguanylate cyclase (GGDEF)-like protein/PAS domain S-box-containing protein